MARRRRAQRDTSDIANLGELLDPVVMPSPLQLSPYPLPLLEDRRQFYPAPATRPALSFNQYTEFEVHEQAANRARRRNDLYGYAQQIGRSVQPRRSNGRATKNSSYLSPQIAFRDGNRVAICVRRKRRKEVLHAIGKAGGRTRRPRRYNAYSQVRC